MGSAGFNTYALYYDLLYQDKNYTEEVEYVTSLIKKASPTTKTLLDVGCGTGSHLAGFKKNNFDVTGIDLSEKMLRIAKKKNPDILFFEANAQHFYLNKQYDVVISLFHVASYQVSNRAFLAYLQSIYAHLRPGGLFIFDFWYGTAVLQDPPVVRIKRMENIHHECFRIAEPTMMTDTNQVKIDFEIWIRNKDTKEVNTIHEQHDMRYFFLPELDFFISQAGFTSYNVKTWMSFEDGIAPNSWYGTAVVRK